MAKLTKAQSKAHQEAEAPLKKGRIDAGRKNFRLRELERSRGARRYPRGRVLHADGFG